MQATPTLPGLERLISVLREHGAKIETRPASDRMPKAGVPVLGHPLDPALASFYSCFNGGHFGDLWLFRGVDEQCGLQQENEQLNWLADERYKKVFRFGIIDGFAHYMGTVPSLADARGVQPVVEASNYTDFDIYPIASNVDRMFALYARYCEARFERYGSLKWDQDNDYIAFPDHFISEIARDTALIRMLEEGRFEELTFSAPDSRAWVSEVLAAARALG